MLDKDLIPIKTLHEVTERLERLKIDHMLTGSMAMFAYSIYRYTADLDFVLELETRGVPAMVAAFQNDYYISDSSARQAIASQRMFNVINIATGFKVDCVIKKSTPFQLNAFDRKVRLDFSGREIYTITKEDLILSKLLWASESRSDKQITDITNLLMGDNDTEYLDEWASRLGITVFLEECRAEVDR